MAASSEIMELINNVPPSVQYLKSICGILACIIAFLCSDVIRYRKMRKTVDDKIIPMCDTISSLATKQLTISEVQGTIKVTTDSIQLQTAKAVQLNEEILKVLTKIHAMLENMDFSEETEDIRKELTSLRGDVETKFGSFHRRMDDFVNVMSRIDRNLEVVKEKRGGGGNNDDVVALEQLAKLLTVRRKNDE